MHQQVKTHVWQTHISKYPKLLHSTKSKIHTKQKLSFSHLCSLCQPKTITHFFAHLPRYLKCTSLDQFWVKELFLGHRFVHHTTYLRDGCTSILRSIAVCWCKSINSTHRGGYLLFAAFAIKAKVKFNELYRSQRVCEHMWNEFLKEEFLAKGIRAFKNLVATARWFLIEVVLLFSNV